MKIKFLLILIFLSVKILACSCAEDAIAQNYLDSDIVGIITIDSTYGDTIWENRTFGFRTYKAKIHFDKIFKGQKFKELNVIGNSKNINSGACETLVEPGKKYLILLNKNSNGEYTVSLCSSMFQINTNDLKTIDNYSKQFSYLEKNNLIFKDFKFINYYDSSVKLDELNNVLTNEFKSTFGQKLKNKFGVYKIKLDSENNIIEINSIKKTGLNERKILTLIKKNIKAKYLFNKSPNSEYLLFLDFNS
ncbi:hypothetical protein [Epilithonimonas zeae]|uniref:hypothetical protein n=1 Tax=Epilithonimonas zeae TaxID=1416779 RepID=UPI00200BDC91|nr:hypothetical protein [Epilithonimonas zeae]UQB70140.1 hypothetical protein KI430_06855 [Epilithonimonas zeae]